MRARSTGAAVVFAVLLASLGPRTAQAQPADTRAEQLALYRQAFAAFEDGDHAAAVALLRRAIARGDLDILHLTLGRVLLQDGQCDEALAELDRAERAPAAGDPPPREVRLRIALIRADAARECPGRLVLRCTPATARVRVDDGPAAACPAEPLTLAPGRHRLVTSAGDARVQQNVEIVGARTIEVTVHVEPIVAPPRSQRPSRSPWPALTLGAGGVVLATALLVDTTVVRGAVSDFREAVRDGSADAAANKRRAESWQLGTIVTYGVGGLLLAAGTVMMLLAQAADSADQSAQ